MTIQAQLADGRVLEFPDGTDPSVIQATVKRIIANPLAAQSTEALESAKSAPMSFGDTFKSLSSGVIGGGKSIVDFFGAGTDVSKGLGEAQSFLQQSLTPERKEEITRREELQNRAARSGSMLQEAKAFLGGVAEAPVQSLAQAAGSSVPAIAVGILALPVEAPAALAIGVGTIAKLTVGAMQGVGEYKGSVFDAVKAEYMKRGKSEQEAEALAIKSQEYSRDKAFEIGGSALLGALDAVTGAEPGVAKALRKAAPTGVLTKEAIEKGVAALPDKAIKDPSYLGQFVKGIAAEAPLEGSQGAFGQYGENVALQQAGADVTPMQGVLGAGLRDAAVGALFGGTASPLGMKSARQEYATDQFLRQAKEDIELDKRAAESEKIKQQAREGLGATGKQLLLPAPGKTYEEPKDLLQDPVGRITEDELGKAIGNNTVVNYLNKYRRDNNLPKLKSYSVEDIKDAMTAQNPEGEEGALNSILAYKTGYKDETYTLEDINNIAVAKNVATETKGFSDFLTRATGKSDLNTMTQPQLHSVAKALEALPRTGKEEQLVLPEGSNATRFTQDQYNQGVTTALMGVKQGKPVSLDQARNAVKAQTDLKTDRDADQVLKTAASNEDLIIERGTGFQATNKTGEVLGTYGTEAEARRNHRRADITPVETQLVRAPEEVKAEKATQFPQGYGIEKTAEVGEERPAAFVLREEGSQKNASQTFAEEIDAKRHQELLVRKREATAAAKDAEADRIRKQLEAQQGSIAQMEADGLTGTGEHTKAVNAFKAANVSKSDQITKLIEEAQVLRTPLQVVPLGKKSTKVEKHTVTKGGKKLGTFPNKTEAEKSILAQATEEELQTIADRGGAFGKRAEVELGERKRTTPGIKVKGTKEGLEAAGVHTPEVEAQLAELKAKLIPMLKKFGLEQVGLNVVRAIENDADGAWGKADKLIRIALQATKPIQTMRHEALHALKELGFFTPQQWEALKRQAEKTWVNTYLKGQMVEVNGKKMTRYDAYANGVKNDDGSWALKPLSPEDILEEAIADAFGSWEGGAKPPPGLMAALFKRLQQFFTALRQALTGAGFESAEDIFGKIERGELKAGKQEGGTEAKMSLSGAGVPMSTRSLMEVHTPVAQQELGLNTEAKRGRFNNVREIATALNQYTLDQIGAMDRNNLTPQDSTKIATAIADEVAFQLNATSKTGTGLGWYSNNYPNAVKRLSKRFPELGTNQHARSVFSAIVAVTSNGEKVAKNIDNAIKLYADLRLGKPLVAMSNRRATALENNLAVIETLLAKHGQDFEKVLLKEITVKEMNARLREMGEESDGSYLADTIVPAAAVYFGPKLGAFYANLSGSEGYLTMDLWWTRSINRMRGLLMPQATEASITKFRDMMDSPEISRDEVIAATIPLRNKYEEFGFNTELEHLVGAKEPAKKNEKPKWFKRAEKVAGDAYEQFLFDHRSEKMANTIYKNEFEMLEEAPFTATDRKFMYDAARKAQDMLRKEGVDLTLADIQAALWYYEKRLYEKLSGRKADDIGYEEAIIAQANQGNGRARPSVVFDKQPSSGTQPTGASKQADGVRGEPTGSDEKLSLRIPDTKGFKNWVGKDPIIPASDTSKYKGGSAVFQAFHGTTYNNITVFDPERGSQQGALGAGPYFSTSAKDASANYAGIGPDLKLRIELLADQLEEDFTYYFDENRERLQEYFDDNNIKVDANDLDPKAPKFEDNSPDKYFDKASKYLAQKQLKGDSDGLVMPVFIKLKKPFDMTSKKIEFMYDPDSEGSEVDDWGKLIDGISALADEMYVVADKAISAIQDNADGMTARKLRDIIRDNIALYDDPFTGEPSSPNQFLQYLLKELGYDGIIQNASDEYSTMVGVERSRDPSANRTFHIMPFTPQQVKSATGNSGNFDATNKDIRYSLRTFFPTAEAAEKAAYKKAPPGTAEFKRFFGGSKVMEEGRAQPMFHASMEDFNIFRENRPIFVSPDAGFAEDFIKRRIRESGSLSYLSEGQVKKKTAKIYPLWVRAETPFDYENKNHVEQIVNYVQANYAGWVADLGAKNFVKDLSSGKWTVVENSRTQEALKTLGFDSFYTQEGGAKNLAVFKANQVKSITGNLGSFDESGDIRYSLREFKPDDLPKNNKPYTLPENTMIFHGAHGVAAKKIEEAGKTLLAYPGIKSSGGSMDEAGLIFFGGRDTATDFANSQADQVMVEALEKKEGKRLPGTVFETATDRPYKLMSRYQKLSAKEANELNAVLGLPDYKRLKAGDSADLASSRAYTNSRALKEYNIQRGEQQIPMKVTWPVIFKTLGFDGFYDNQNVPAVALTADNGIRLIGDDGKMVKYSLKPVSADIDAAIDRTTTAREDKGFIGRILEAIFPQSAGHFRQQALNRYNQLGVYDRMLADKMGGAAMLADQSAESAALMSDLSASVTASAFGYGNRTGGVPVYKNGITTIDTSVKGPIAILASLAKYNNPRIYQRYQFWAGVKRGKRFMADGKEKNFEQADIARAAQLEKEHPEFVQVQKEMNEFNNGLVKYMVQTGVIDPVRAKIYMEHADYIPFYRQMDGERTVGPNIFQSISGVKAPKALKGSEAPLADYLETIVRNTQSAIQSGMKNTAAQRAVNVAMKLGPKVGAERLKTQESGFDIVQVLEKGERVSYRVADTLFIDACRSLNLPDLPFMGFLAAPANALRNLVTKDPGFMLANLMRDSLSSWVTSGANVTPIIGTISGFTKALSGKSASMEALLNAGILGGYEFSSGVLKSGEVLEADMNKKYGKATGAKVLLKPFTSLWDALEKGTEASDAATRIAIYERVLADTGNEAEAIFRSLEVMNFNRKGSSAIIRIATAAIPFLNARMQGLDIFYRTSFGRDTVADPAAKQKAFFVRGATLMALSIAMYTMVSDDDEYKKQEDETKDNYWIIPGVGKFPTPFEVGFLFKTVPERIYAYMFKDDTGEDFKEAMKRGIISTLAFNPIPQTVKPLIEASWNYNSFTGRVIVGAGMENRSPEFQVGPGTSEVAQRIGSLTGLSPLKVDHVWQGYTGTIGMYLVQAVDSVLNANDNSPNASKRFEQLPIIKRFALDPEARGNITQFYALKNATDQAVTTINFLERSGDAEAYAKYFEENAGLLANKNYVNSIEKQMKKYREMRAMVQSAEMTGDEKRDLLIDIGRAENALNENIKEVKKMIKEVQ